MSKFILMIIITLTCIVTKNKFKIYCIDVKNIYQMKNIKTLKLFSQKIETLDGVEKNSKINTMFVHDIKDTDPKIFSNIFNILLRPR